MGKYVENNIGMNENIVQKAKLTKLFLVGTWIKGILLCWLLFIPVFKAIVATIRHFKTELGITNKRIIGKVGIINTKALDAPLNKIQNVSSEQKFWGKIFNYGTIKVNTAAGSYDFDGVSSPDEFKRSIMNQIEQYEQDRVKQQAAEMASAMAGALKA